jgi:hypothetical protein
MLKARFLTLEYLYHLSTTVIGESAVCVMIAAYAVRSILEVHEDTNAHWLHLRCTIVVRGAKCGGCIAGRVTTEAGYVGP